MHVVRGDAARSTASALEAGDAAQLEGEPRLLLDDGQDAEVLVFDLAERRSTAAFTTTKDFP